eukprot:157224_1
MRNTKRQLSQHSRKPMNQTPSRCQHSSNPHGADTLNRSLCCDRHSGCEYASHDDGCGGGCGGGYGDVHCDSYERPQSYSRLQSRLQGGQMIPTVREQISDLTSPESRHDHQLVVHFKMLHFVA